MLFPAAMGFFLAWYMTYASKRNEVVATRILILIGTLMLFSFVDVYVAAVGNQGLTINRQLIPNTSFLVAVALYMNLRGQTPAWVKQEKAAADSKPLA